MNVYKSKYLGNEIDNKIEEIDDIQTTTSQFNTKITSLEENIQSSTENITTIQQKLSEIQTDLDTKATSNKVETLETDTNTNIANINELIENINSSITQINSMIETLQTAISTKAEQGTIENIDENKANKTEIVELNNNIQEALSTKANKTELSTLDTKLDETKIELQQTIEQILAMGQILGIANTANDILTQFPNPTDKDIVIVLSDENNNNNRTIYMYNADDEIWSFLGHFNITLNDATTEQRGIVQLSDNINSDSSNFAATSKAVKIAYDLAADRNADTLNNKSASDFYPITGGVLNGDIELQNTLYNSTLTPGRFTVVNNDTNTQTSIDPEIMVIGDANQTTTIESDLISTKEITATTINANYLNGDGSNVTNVNANSFKGKSFDNFVTSKIYNSEEILNDATFDKAYFTTTKFESVVPNMTEGNSGYWHIISIPFQSGGCCTQLAFPLSANTAYIRSSKEGKFNKWNRMSDNGKTAKELTITMGGTSIPFNGSTPRDIEITPSAIGAIPSTYTTDGFNDLKLPGIYSVYSKDNSPNNSSSYWAVIVMNTVGISGNHVHQIAMKKDTIDMFMRSYDGTTWSDWVKNGSSTNDNSINLQNKATITYDTTNNCINFNFI